MTLVAELIFAAAAATLLYTYCGFPLLLLARATFWRQPYAEAPIHPRVAVVIAAYNEESCIERKIASVLAADYPPEQLTVVVASDGSTDGTAAAVQRVNSPQVKLLQLPRAGKAATLNAAVAQVEAEILVFTDANSMFDRDTLTELVRPFADPKVGGVAGDQRYLKSADAALTGRGERSYWSIDRWLKQLASQAGNTISATGALYAIRYELFQGVPAGVTDDFAISTSVVAQGRRLVFQRTAAVYEPVAASGRVEFDRKVRVMSRGFRSVWLRRDLMNPMNSGFYACQLLSHKLLRRLMVFPLAALLVASLWLWQESWFYRLAAMAQLLFYGSALLPLVLGRAQIAKVLSLPFYFCMVNAAAMVALWQTLRGNRITLWEPQRSESAPTTGSQ